MLNVVAIMGRLVADPELRHTPGGVSVAGFTLAVERSFAKAGEPRKTDFVDLVAWRQQAEFICKYFRKGSLVAIDGELQTESYKDKNGNSRKRTNVVVRNVSFTGEKKQAEPAPVYDEGGEAAPAGAAVRAAAAPEYSGGAQDDFALIDDGEDLPF